ncbi:MAG: helix-turn-helix transcriptional regulator [Ktedonobacteraceae bacterium]|nr:helix-turn-helix transcriptional regulator [Ktedonobacteraceae bacterium]
MQTLYWWSRYGDFSPGMGILPHMGQVIAHYRKQRYRTQLDFAKAAGVILRTIQEWEAAIMTNDQERRIFLAKLLKIPPALLGLDWRLVYYQDNTGTHEVPSEQWVHLLEEDTFYHYEDLLTAAWDMFYSGRLFAIATRVERRLTKLVKLVQEAPAQDKEAWLWMLGQYYYIAGVIAGYGGKDEEHQRRAVSATTSALQIAQEIDDAELMGLCLYRLTGLHLTQKSEDLAKQTIQGALNYAERVGTPLRASMQLREAEVLTRFAATDDALAKRIRHSQDRVVAVLYRGKMEQDRSFLKLNLAGVHHERAKTLIQFHTFHPDRKHLLKDAHHEMQMAWDALTPDLAEWRGHFFLTEARLYQAERDVEASVKLALNALQAAREVQSKGQEDQVRSLYHELMHMDTQHPLIHNLGVQLGIF